MRWDRTLRLQQRRALTLIELLVVLLLLSTLALGVLPSTAFLLTRARDRDVQGRLLDSWKLARAMALSNNTPVLWAIAQGDDVVTVTLRPCDSDPAEAKELKLRGYRIASGEAMHRAAIQRVIPVHGLSRPLKLELVREGRVMSIVLPSAIDDSIGEQAD